MKNTADRLPGSDQLLRLVLEALPVGVSVLDPRGDILLSNPAALRIWARLIQSGADRYAESRGWFHATGVRLAPEDWPSARALSRGETTVDELIDIEAFDGTRRVIQSSAMPIRDATGNITGAFVVLEDVSGRTGAGSPGGPSTESPEHTTPLTPREREVLQLVAEGWSSQEAADSLGVSIKTIETHRAHIMRKLELRSVSDLVRYAIRNKLVQP